MSFFKSALKCDTRSMLDQTEFEVRLARPKDYPALLGLSARLTIGVAPWRNPAKVATAVRGWVESSLASAEEDGHAVLVTLLGGHVVGLVSLAEREHFTGELDAYVSELAVDAAIEGRGGGRALMTAAEQWAAGRGLSRVMLETGARNYRARRFYVHAGYQEEEVRLTKVIRVAR
jgi:GNAT superfamily N-acetyltransferase